MRKEGGMKGVKGRVVRRRDLLGGTKETKMGNFTEFMNEKNKDACESSPFGMKSEASEIL